MSNIGPEIVMIISGVIGLAIIAVIVSKNANTQNVLTGAGTALSGVISSAVSPISGTQSSSFASPSTITSP